MCLNTEKIVPYVPVANLIKAGVRYAYGDITCWKVFSRQINGNLVTPYQRTKWPINKTMTVTNFGALRCPDNSLSIAEGLHAYLSKKRAIINSKGLGKTVVKKMIIPTGTQYFKSADGTQIVALAMKIDRSNERPKRKPAKTSKRKLVSKRKKK